MARSRARCFQCGRPVEVCGYVSKRGLCEDCAYRNYMDNVMAVTGRSEKAHAEWKAKWLAGCGQWGGPTKAYPPDA